MNPRPAPTTAALELPADWWLRAYRAFMPDYNRKATAYWTAMVLLGAAIHVYTLRSLLALPTADWLTLAVGTAIAMLAGFFPVRVPRSKNSFAAGEIFIFLLLLLYGPAAATLAAAGEGLIGSWRTSKRWTSRIASPTMSALAMFGAGQLMTGLFGLMGTTNVSNPGLLLLAAMVVALVYFVTNTFFVSLVFTLKRSEPFNFGDFLGSFGSIGIAYGGSALIAALLFLTVQSSGLSVLLGALPVIAMLLTTVHYFMRQQEANDTVRKSRIEAAEREAEQSTKHLAALRDSERRFHSAFTHASIGMALVSFEGRILQANAALASLLGEPQGETLVDQPFGALLLESDLPILEREFTRIHAKECVASTAPARRSGPRCTAASSPKRTRLHPA
jgi:PAS domain-containing protein